MKTEEKSYNVTEAVQSQIEFCKEYAKEHPDDWASERMSRGQGFAPKDGICYRCHQQIYSAKGAEIWNGRRTGRMTSGIDVETARNSLTQGCPFCYYSFVD